MRKMHAFSIQGVFRLHAEKGDTESIAALLGRWIEDNLDYEFVDTNTVIKIEIGPCVE